MMLKSKLGHPSIDAFIPSRVRSQGFCVSEMSQSSVWAESTQARASLGTGSSAAASVPNASSLGHNNHHFHPPPHQGLSQIWYWGLSQEGWLSQGATGQQEPRGCFLYTQRLVQGVCSTHCQASQGDRRPGGGTGDELVSWAPFPPQLA